MGTDIKVYAEIYDGKRWRPAEPLVENDDYDPEDDPLQPRLSPQRIFDTRIRNLFHVLSSDIAPCRGLPPDISTEIAEYELAFHDCGIFGHGWLGLEELLAYDWAANLDRPSRAEFCERVLPRLQSFGPPNSVRIVFWFGC